MNIYIKCQHWLDQHLAVKQWLWFIGLWCAGLVSVFALTYPLRLLMKML